MDFGMPTLVECPTPEQSVALCAELGLDFVELNMNLPEYQLDCLDGAALHRLFARHGKYPTIHLDENLNVCDFNRLVANAYWETVMQTIALAKVLSAPIITMHLARGVWFTLPDRHVYLFEQYRDVYLQGLQRFRDACDAAIGDSGILLCIENCGVFHDFQRDGIDLLLESRHFALTYDIGHEHSAENGNQAFLAERVGRIKHMHVHDALGKRNHLPLGSGEIDLAEKLALARRQSCRCVLETKTAEALRQSVAYVRR